MSVLCLPQTHIHALFHGLETLYTQFNDERISLIDAIERTLSDSAQAEINDTLSTLNIQDLTTTFSKKLKAYFIEKNFIAYTNEYLKSNGCTFDEDESNSHVWDEHLADLRDLTTPSNIPNVKPYDLFVLVNAYSYNTDMLSAYKTTFNEIYYILRQAMISTVKGEDLSKSLFKPLSDHDVIQAMQFIKIERDEDAVVILNVQNEILTTVGLHAQLRGFAPLSGDSVESELKKLEVLNKLNYFAIKHQISYHKEIEAELIRAFDPYFAPQPRNGLGMLWTVDRFQDLNLREEYPIHWDFRKDKQHPRLREIENRVSCSFS